MVAISDKADVAILKVDDVTLKPLMLTKAADAKIGADLFCVAYPLADTMGVNPKLTYLRELTLPTPVDMTPSPEECVLQRTYLINVKIKVEKGFAGKDGWR